VSEPKLGVTEQVIAEQVLLDSTVDDSFHHFSDRDWAAIGWVGCVLLFVSMT